MQSIAAERQQAKTDALVLQEELVSVKLRAAVERSTNQELRDQLRLLRSASGSPSPAHSMSDPEGALATAVPPEVGDLGLSTAVDGSSSKKQQPYSLIERSRQLVFGQAGSASSHQSRARPLQQGSPPTQLEQQNATQAEGGSSFAVGRFWHRLRASESGKTSKAKHITNDRSPEIIAAEEVCTQYSYSVSRSIEYVIHVYM